MFRIAQLLRRFQRDAHRLLQRRHQRGVAQLGRLERAHRLQRQQRRCLRAGDVAVHAIKAEDIVVYTVAFDLGGNQNAIDIKQDGASGEDSAYTADDGAALTAAFNSIAQNISALRLTH